MRVKIDHTRLSDAPYNEANKVLFIGTGWGTRQLLDDLLHGNPTSYLISGYRGAGKTSFIKRLEEEVKTKGDPKKPFIFIYINFSRYTSDTVFLRKLIRALNLTVQEAVKREVISIKGGTLELLEQLNEKTFF